MMIDVVESALVQYAEVKSVVALQDWFTCSSSCRAWNSMLLCNRLPAGLSTSLTLQIKNSETNL